MITLKTSRLILRPWRDDDFEPFAMLNADPRVMEYFPALLSREESDQLIYRFQKIIDEQGWGIWAASVPGIADFIGFIGLNRVTFAAPFTPAVEVGWRLAFPYWGKGYASEGAKEALRYGFEVLHLPEIVSFTAVENKRSRAVMQRIGMHHDPADDFDHPRIAEGNPLRRHVLYRITEDAWKKSRLST